MAYSHLSTAVKLSLQWESLAGSVNWAATTSMSTLHSPFPAARPLALVGLSRTRKQQVSEYPYL
ncbi:hypothetical protein PENSUB_295 [Penicillium subrubescens]|uniref:Uncharacterized protein n=1 Tax=Penicillium subrubescens TaxID=1316194 RepID=A0A1Q5UNI4_9EURO|nr:hypothetical protein PENSUB_295 [Penicillium subrubescens]